jgi:deoxyribonuclease V
MPFSTKKAKRAQQLMADHVEETPLSVDASMWLAGADVAYHLERAIAAVTLVSIHDSIILETATLTTSTPIPYIPGFLGFREASIMTRTVQHLSYSPDVVLVDGHGVAHPRRFGLACHVGIILDIPTIGVAKTRFYGSESNDKLLDSSGNIIAHILYSQGGKPYYVSVGHKITLDDAVTVVERCMGEHGPYPLQLAHRRTQEIHKAC